jgi:thioredoxin reductase (NADPH)
MSIAFFCSFWGLFVTESINKVTIIGTGPAGLTAAIYAARAALNPVIYAGMQHGGQLTTTTEVENFPGFAHGIMGPQLMQDMTAQAERVGAKIVYEEVTGCDFSSRPLKLMIGDKTVLTETVIISTGASAKTLGLPHEWELMGKGLSTCATCDGFFYRGKSVAVIGGGDSAMEEANYLTKMCSEVYLIHRRDYFKASPIMLERARKNPKIKFLVPFGVEKALYDDKGVNGLLLKHSESGEHRELKIDGAFMAIGHSPNSKPFAKFLETDSHGYLKVHEHTKTKVPGVFAAGDIADPYFRQAVTAAGMGCQAAIQAQRYLEELEG